MDYYLCPHSKLATMKNGTIFWADGEKREWNQPTPQECLNRFKSSLYDGVEDEEQRKMMDEMENQEISDHIAEVDELIKKTIECIVTTLTT